MNAFSKLYTNIHLKRDKKLKTKKKNKERKREIIHVLRMDATLLSFSISKAHHYFSIYYFTSLPGRHIKSHISSAPSQSNGIHMIHVD